MGLEEFEGLMRAQLKRMVQLRLADFSPYRSPAEVCARGLHDLKDGDFHISP